MAINDVSAQTQQPPEVTVPASSKSDAEPGCEGCGKKRKITATIPGFSVATERKCFAAIYRAGKELKPEHILPYCSWPAGLFALRFIQEKHLKRDKGSKLGSNAEDGKVQPEMDIRDATVQVAEAKGAVEVIKVQTEETPAAQTVQSDAGAQSDAPRVPKRRRVTRKPQAATVPATDAAAAAVVPTATAN